VTEIALPPKHALKDMTFMEFRERLAERPVILLPLGSQEEQGPHAPMGDYMLAEKIAEGVAERSGAISAPVLPFGHADFFRPVPGGIQLRAETFTMVFEDMVTAFLDHGIDRIVVLNGHSTNAPLIEQVLRRLRRETGVAVAAIHLWQALPPDLWNRLHGKDTPQARGHGADPLTSVYLHLFPELVRMDLAPPPGHAPKAARIFGLPTEGVRGVAFGGASVQLPLDVTEVTKNGIMAGDPHLARAAIGAEIVAWLTDFSSRFVAHLRECDPRSIASNPAPDMRERA
jgi:creatinine amidohydrolase